MGNKNNSSPQDGHISGYLRCNTSGSAQPESEILTYEKFAERRSTLCLRPLFTR